MSVDDLRSIHDSSDNHPVCGRDVPCKPFCQGPVANGGDADSGDANDFAPSSLGSTPSGNSVVARVILTKLTAIFRLSLEACRLAAMQQNGDELNFVNACLDERYDTAFDA